MDFDLVVDNTNATGIHLLKHCAPCLITIFFHGQSFALLPELLDNSGLEDFLKILNANLTTFRKRLTQSPS
ncbi:hypothethical protein (plasmid) [Ralstonia solanacearum CMR15]|nr:hypothethical protein [Ralstonia solanacearum CMR15]